MDQSYLNNLFSQYKNGVIKRGEFEGSVYQYFVKNQENTCLSHWKYDEYEDFISWFYTRLHKTIDSYNETGASFDAYFSSIMRMAAKEYRIQTITNRVIEYSAWSVQVPDLYVFEEAPVYSYECHEDAISKIIVDHKGRKNPKQLLTLILKCYYHVSDDFLERIARYTGVDKDKLKEMIETMRKIRQEKDDYLYHMKERVYCQYYRCIVYEKRLSYTPENSPARLKLQSQLEKGRHRLEKMRKGVNAIRTDATNKEVAEVIGISKGTVDSTLHKLRARLDSLSDKSILN